MTEKSVRKAEPAGDYPPEEGCHLRGNDYSRVAVVVILRWQREETPPETIGIEKIVCNIVASPWRGKADGTWQ